MQTQEELSAAFAANFSPCPDTSVEAMWQHYSSCLWEAAKTTLGHPKRRKQDWFDDSDSSISELLDQKRKAHQVCLSNPSSQRLRDNFRHIKAKLQRKLRDMEDKWWDEKAEEIQQMADLGDTRGYYKALKTIFELNGNQSSPVLDINGVTLLTEETDIKKRWREYFSQLLNQTQLQMLPSSIGLLKDQFYKVLMLHFNWTK